MQAFIAGYCEISLIKSISERRSHFEKEENGRRILYTYIGKNQLVTKESDQEKIHFTYN